MEKKAAYQNNSINSIIALFILSAFMMGFSIYLTGHYFDLKFPTGLESGSLCNLNSFFNCDKTTLSKASNIGGVPISIFGIIIGALTMIGIFVKNERYERTIYCTLIINFLGCILLFSYSLFFLGGLCPFCTLYYIASGLALFLLYKRGHSYFPDFPVAIAFISLALVASFITSMNINSRLKKADAVSNDLIKQYYSLPNLGTPLPISPFKISDSPNAPIQMAIFSDFECPACKALSDLMPQILLRYGNKINILYYFYPLDNACNPSMQNALHRSACKAASLASCFPVEKFGIIHDEIFHNQERLADYLNETIKKNSFEACIADQKTKDLVASLIQAATPFNVRSTPTFLLNGVKIEGVLPSDQLFAIMDEILKRSK